MSARPTRRAPPPPASSPSNCRSSCRRSRSRPSGRTSSACGATRSTRCARTSRASRPPSTHAFIARYSRPGDVVLDPFSGRGTTPLQACAEGRIGVGNDLNPFAHLLTAAKVEPATRAEADDAPRRAAARLERRVRRLAGPRRAGGRRPGRLDVAGPGRRLRRRPGRRRRSPCPPRSRSRSIRGRSASCCSSARRCGSTTGRTGSSPPRSPASCTARARRYLSELMPNTFSMAPRYVRDFARADRVRVARARRLRRPRREARPALPPAAAADRRASRCSATPATSPHARPGGAARARPARAGAARRDLAAVPARREVRLLQLAADVVPRASTPARSTRRSTTPITASRTSLFLRDVLAGLRPILTDDAVVVLVIGDVETDRGRRIRAASASPSGSGRPPPSPRATGSPASRSTTSPPSAR